MRLILFDVDGTLIHSNRGGRAALAVALQSVFGAVGPLDSYPMSGKTDARIIHDLLGAAGFSRKEIERQIERVYEEMAREAAALYEGHGMTPCRGVPELVAALHERDDVLLGLLTGNSAHTAPLKLEAAGLDPALFPIGAYGSDSADRNRLPAVARQRAEAYSGQSIAPDACVIVGDTPADIVCARSSGAVAVAVATGSYSLATLATYEPDLLLSDLGSTASVVAKLLGDR